MSHIDAQKEKSLAALSSVIAAVGLTTFKIIVGIATNSLGILAEAAHSGRDLMAAAMTFFLSVWQTNLLIRSIRLVTVR